MHNLEKIESIGCFYSFEKTVIVKSQIKNKKLYLGGETLYQSSIKDIVEKLKIYSFKKIFINQHHFINQFFHYRLREIDFSNELLIKQMNDFYKSLIKDEKLVIEDMDTSKSHAVKGIYLALYGVNPKLLYFDCQKSFYRAPLPY
jgi:competence CoiA-like predicted nuclease